MTALLIYALTGAFAGILAGLFGVGGGLVIVPALVFIFERLHLTPAHTVHLAVGTSLATIIFTSLSSLYAHHRHGAVRWPLFRQLSPGLVIGALLGVQLAALLPSQALRSVFGVFELLVALQMALAAKPAAKRPLPGLLGLSAGGTAIGTVSAIVGVGGGTLTVPFLIWCRVNTHHAVATAAACGLPIAVAGMTGFIVAGLNVADLPAWSTGYVYWQAVAGIVVFSMLTAPLGARLAHRLPATHLKRFFAVFLAGLGIKMLFF